MDRKTEQQTRQLASMMHRADLGAGRGISVRTYPRLAIRPTVGETKVVKTVTHLGTGRYRVREINHLGTELGMTPFEAYELDGSTTVGDGTRVVCYPTADGRTYVFFRLKQRLVEFDGGCHIDAADAGNPHPAVYVAMVENTVGGGGVIIPDANTEEYLLLHFERPIVVTLATQAFMTFGKNRVTWDLDNWMWGDLRYSFYLDWITQDFDWDNDGDPLPARNTWNARPTHNLSAGPGGGVVDLDVETSGSAFTVYDEYQRPRVYRRLPNAAAYTAYGIQIRCGDWFEGGLGTIFDAAKTEWSVAHDYSYVILG